MSVHSQLNRQGDAGVAFDRQSLLSHAADRRSMASSLLLNDFNGKKSKMLQSLRQLDELKSGVIKQSVFENILGCLDVQLDQVELDEWQRKQQPGGLCFHGQPYIKYEAVIRSMHFDNHSEKWALRRTNDEADTLSVITEK